MQINTPFNDKEQEYNIKSRLNGKAKHQEDFFIGNRKVTFKDALILEVIAMVICIVMALIYFL